MAVTIGMGQYVYEYHADWARLPEGRSFQSPSAVAVDSKDRVYVAQRSDPVVLVFDRDGYFLDEWRRRVDELLHPHHIYISPDDRVFIADLHTHQVFQYTTEGVLVNAWGTRNRPAMQAPFSHPADIAIAPTGEIYMADGYGNSSVHRFSADGRYISSFGSPGNGPGQFKVPHSVRISKDGRVFVCDRENSRVQVFNADGGFITEWTDFKYPMGIHIDSDQIVYVTDQVPRLSVLTLEGELLSRGLTIHLGHNVFSNSKGDLYSVDVSNQELQTFIKSS